MSAAKERQTPIHLVGPNLCRIWRLQNVPYKVHVASLVPRPTPFFVLRFAFSIIHGGRRARKTGKAWEHLSRE